MAGIRIPLNWRTGVVAVCVVISMLFVFVPRVFYGATDDEAMMLVPVYQQYQNNEYKIASLETNLIHEIQKERVLRSKQPWFGQLPPDEQFVYDRQVRKIDDMKHELAIANSNREGMATEMRAMTPVFSKACVDEVHRVWWERQGNHAQMSKNFFLWDMLFDGFDGRGDSLTEVLAGLAIRFIWRLSVGAVIALIDFLIRLPFYLREYEVYKIVPVGDIGAGQTATGYIPPPSSSTPPPPKYDNEGSEETMYGDKNEGTKPRSRDDSSYQYQQASGFERQGAPRARLHAYAFFGIAALGAIGATTLLLLLIWSPCLILLGIIWRNQQQRRRGGHYD